MTHLILGAGVTLVIFLIFLLIIITHHWLDSHQARNTPLTHFANIFKDNTYSRQHRKREIERFYNEDEETPPSKLRNNIDVDKVNAGVEENMCLQEVLISKTNKGRQINHIVDEKSHICDKNIV